MLPTLPFTSVSSKNPPHGAGGVKHPNHIVLPFGRTGLEDSILRLPGGNHRFNRLVQSYHLLNIRKVIGLNPVKLAATFIFNLQNSNLTQDGCPNIVSRLKPHLLTTVPFTIFQSIQNPTYSRVMHIGFTNRAVSPGESPAPFSHKGILSLTGERFKSLNNLCYQYRLPILLDKFKNTAIILWISKEVKI